MAAPPGHPGQPQNPEFIVADTSALFQLVMCDQITLLRTLKADYGVQTAIVEAVEAELRFLLADEKFKSGQPVLRKAFGNRSVEVLNKVFLKARYGPIADGLLAQMNQRGAEMARIVDRGEAYSHSAAMILSVPIATHDYSAVNRLFQEGVVVPRPIIRAFDLVVFGLQTECLTEQDCNGMRKELFRKQQYLPQCFERCAFRDGLPNFYARVLDGSKPRPGSRNPKERFDDACLYLRRRAMED